MPIKPDLFFGYNGVKVALYINNNTVNGHSATNGTLNCSFVISENFDPNL